MTIKEERLRNIQESINNSLYSMIYLSQSTSDIEKHYDDALFNLLILRNECRENKQNDKKTTRGRL